MFNLHNIYRRGEGVQRDEARAHQWLRKAAEKAGTRDQELTLVHYSAQRKHFLWDTLGEIGDKNGSG